MFVSDNTNQAEVQSKIARNIEKDSGTAGKGLVNERS